MREILFRGKTAKGEWIYGFYMNEDVKNIIVDTTCGSLGFGLQVDRETVGQYTGLTDKNGTKIFEGDILLKGFEKVLVKWNNNQCRWGIYSNGYEISGFNESTKNYFEVIGNIHDNPELMKGEKQ